ncbi:MAG: Ni/Fe hydrogenase subunit alpha [Thermoprotei archaeon]|nr:MAG: Ni/Fe hydrogenase subunit alpha [Thermoprotei archaeon]
MSGSIEVRIDYLTRVEGEGTLYLKLSDGNVERVEVGISEPTRFFEALLRGRKYYEAPDITSRICGICPLAYVMSACRAMEKLLGIRVPDEVRLLRKIAYLGEWISSHALHVTLLHAPDFLGFNSAFDMMEKYSHIVKAGLRVKWWGDKVIEVIGGRAIHPISFRVGGFYRIIKKEKLEKLLSNLEAIKKDAKLLLEWVLKLPIPGFKRDLEFISLRNGKEYPILEGRVVSNKGLDIDESEFERYIQVEQTPYSNSLRYRVKGRGSYIVGPIARFNNNYDLLKDEVKDIIESHGMGRRLINSFQSIVARAAEVYHAVLEIVSLIHEYSEPRQPYVEGELREGEASAITEAPRGMLYHRYRINADGTISDANIIPPTSQNLAAIEDDLKVIGAELSKLSFEEAKRGAEQIIRNYDPCISCSVHAIKIVK